MGKITVYFILLLLLLTFENVSLSNAQTGSHDESSDAFDPQVFLTEEQALSEVFPDCDEILYDEIILTEEEKTQLQNSLRRKIFEDNFIVYVGIKSGEVDGYAIITEEVGKFHPYTFIVSVDTKGKIRKIAVLVYRESRGAEIAKKRFLYQFKGKSLKSKIRINKDIINISGATMSVVTMCTGVKKVLAVIDHFYLSGSRTGKMASLERVPFGSEGGRGQGLTMLKKAALSMGTVFEITAYVSDKHKAEKVFDDVFSEINRLDHLMSNYNEESELSKLNKNASSEPTPCDKELVYIIEQSLQYGDITDGAFDITIGPLMEKWGFFKKRGKVPDKEELEATLESVSYKNIIIEDKTNKSLFRDQGAENLIFYRNPSTRIDLGGIGKGYAVDAAAGILRDNGIYCALINFAGNIYACGAPPEKNSWVIGLQHPRQSEGILGSFEIRDKAVSTSGDYENFFTINGKRYSHIIDPRTGSPVKDIVSVTIVAGSATKADALSTGVFVLGLDKGIELIERLPDVEGIIIYEDTDSRLFTKTSSGMQTIFKRNHEDSKKGRESDVMMSGG